MTKKPGVSHLSGRNCGKIPRVVLEGTADRPRDDHPQAPVGLDLPHVTPVRDSARVQVGRGGA